MLWALGGPQPVPEHRGQGQPVGGLGGTLLPSTDPRPGPEPAEQDPQAHNAQPTPDSGLGPCVTG